VIETKRDKAGYITEATGVMSELIDWLSIKYNFKSDLLLELIYYADQHLLTEFIIRYSLLKEIAVRTEDTAYGRGAVSYITSGVHTIIELKISYLYSVKIL